MSILKGLTLFKGLNEHDLAKLERIVEERHYSAGTVLFRQDDPPDAFYIIRSGSVKIIRHEAGEPPRELAVLGEGEFFGEMGILENAPRFADAVIEKDAVLLRIDRQRFQEFMAINPSISLKIMSMMARRYKAAEEPDDGGTRRNAVVIGVFSASGGVGNSFVSANLSVGLRRATSKKVLLLDLDLMFGDQAGIFDVEHPGSLADLHEEREICSAHLERIIVRTKAGIDLLQAPPRPEDSELIGPDLIKVVFQVLKGMYDYVVFDSANAIQDFNITLLESIEKGLLLFTPEFLSIKNAHRWLKILEMINIPTDCIELVLTKDRGTDESFRREMEKRLDKPIAHILPWDYERASTSLNKGELLVDTSRESGLGKALYELALRMSGTQPRPAPKKSLWERLFG